MNLAFSVVGVPWRSSGTPKDAAGREVNAFGAFIHLIKKKPVALCILDGWGLRKETEGNAVALASTPNFDRLVASCPSATLVTHGEAVGLPAGSIGNSEVGHLHIGAGRTILMEVHRINFAIENGEFRKLPSLVEFAEKIRRAGGSAHVIGLVSDSGVHALAQHVVAAVSALAERELPVLIHVVTDGRDTSPGTAHSFIQSLIENIPESTRFATVGGRYFAMDRDRRWERVRKAWDAVILGCGLHAESPLEAIEEAARRGETDEFIQPTVVGRYAGVEPGDGVFIVNFRSDRVRQFASAMSDPAFCGFDSSGASPVAPLLGMVNYFEQPKPWLKALFEKHPVPNTLGEWTATHGRRQFRLAETEKFPHVTYFLNGGKEEPEPGEERHMPQSPKVATYDLQPEMAAAEVAAEFVEGLQTGYDLIVANFANPDMVGHTGNLGAAVRACEEVDRCLGLVLKACGRVGGAMIVTADHGNCEMMIDPISGGPHTAHTTNPVPIAVFGASSVTGLRSGTLSDIAPTLLELMGLDCPQEMTGASLLEFGN